MCDTPVSLLTIIERNEIRSVLWAFSNDLIRFPHDPFFDFYAFGRKLVVVSLMNSSDVAERMKGDY